MALGLAGVVFGLASAASWGAGDFTGGISARRTSVYSIVIVSQAIGLALLIGLALVLSEPVPGPADLRWGAAAGMAGGIGLLLLYRGLAVGRMGVVAPVAAVVSAGVPVLAGLALDGFPTPLQLVGFGLALAAVWLISQGSGRLRARTRELALPLLAGLGFAVFLIAIGQVSGRAILWPLAGARISSLALVLLVAILRRQRGMPARSQWAALVLVGVFDTGGNAFYALAAQAGRLDVAAVLGSLYPATTVLLARLVLKERLSGRQWAGVVAAIAAVVLIAA